MFKVNNRLRTTLGVGLVSLLLTLNIFTPYSSVSTANFELVIFSRVAHVFAHLLISFPKKR